MVLHRGHSAIHRARVGNTLLSELVMIKSNIQPQFSASVDDGFIDSDDSDSLLIVMMYSTTNTYY